tara:strand:+ start:157 stop:471 length:315 start_codon:yes stop_codon:yes gene_type:complete
MQGINEVNANFHLSRNEEIHSLYLNGCTMEEIGKKFNISKQRVWQIIRRCKLGDGNYYAGYQVESEKRKEFFQLTGSIKLADKEYTTWLKSKGVKRIKTKSINT